MSKLLTFVFSILLLSFVANAQDDNSLIFQLKTGEQLQDLPIDTVLAKLNNAINSMSGTHDIQIKQEIVHTLERSKATNDPLKIAKVYQQIGNWHYLSTSSQNKDSIFYYDNQALTQLLKTNDKELISLAYRTVGNDLSDMQKFANAEVQLFNGLKIAQSINYQKAITSIHADLGRLYLNTKDYDSGLKYLLEVVAAYEKEGNTHPLIRALISLNALYVQIGKNEEALTAINKALDLVPNLPESSQLSETINVRAWRGKVYRNLNRYEEALADFEYSWSGVKAKYGDEKADGWKGDIGSIYYLQGKYAAAIPYLKGYIDHVKDKKVMDKEELKNHSIWLAESLKATNQLGMAYDYLAIGKDIEINTLQQETEALRNELRIKYETEQKDQMIASQSEVIEQQQKIQWLTYAIVALLILLLLGLFFTYRNNINKNNQLQLLNNNLATTNTQLDKRNAENELLLKEIHHRVKNNLEVISSLLALQSAQIDDPNVQTAMQASQNRVQSMGILHQKLYQSEHLAFIEMRTYFINLSENILDSYNETERIEVEFPMEDLELDVDTAMPVGLIVNELLTNALKYAFPQGTMGKIKLSLHDVGANILQLSISDNGVGKIINALPQGTGFGTQLVNLLTLQLNGVLTQNVENGTMISIQFSKK
jgi:two-component sensor histidine kinase